MADKIALELQNVSLHYRLQLEKTSTLKEVAVNFLRRRHGYRDLVALSDVTLQVKRGECLGIIGRNGSGKSTMLKVIAGVLTPTSGERYVEGTMAPLIELGAGFNGELTGRENVFLNGALLGRSPEEMRQRYDSIVEFSELKDFMDVPVKNYSSGMYARLGFAIATDVEPDILIVDEVLAVGDAPFSQKCNARIRKHVEDGRTVIFVSHDIDAMRKLCQRGVVLSKGVVRFDGQITEAIADYHEHIGMTPS